MWVLESLWSGVVWVVSYWPIWFWLSGFVLYYQIDQRYKEICEVHRRIEAGRFVLRRWVDTINEVYALTDYGARKESRELLAQLKADMASDLEAAKAGFPGKASAGPSRAV